MLRNMNPTLPTSVRSDRPGRRGALARLGLIGLLCATGCTHAGVVEAEAPVPTARLLEARRTAAPGNEVLRASVEVFGLEIATLESSLCAAPERGTTIATEVEAAPLVKIVKRTSGEARTDLLEAGGTPRTSDYTFRDGDLVRHYKVDYRAGGYAYVYDNGGFARRAGQSDVPEGAEPHDMHSAMLLLRAWRPRLGETGYFYAVLGRRPWRVDVTSRGPEMIKLGEEPRLTYRLDGVASRLWEPEGATPKHFSIWLSEDSARVPLRMVADASFGQVTMTLTDREVGGGSCRAPAVAAGEPVGYDAVGPLGMRAAQRSP
jgi:hypothetical protein